MTKREVKNLCIIGHGSVGKTSLIERLLFEAGSIERLGTIASGTTVGDYLAEEINHKHTTCLKLMNVSWNDTQLFFVDTPGYADFIGETVSAMKIIDSALLVVCGSAGIEVGTDSCWHTADAFQLPRAIFINKLDKENSDYFRVAQQLQEVYGPSCIPLTIPRGKDSSLEGVVNLLNQKELEGLPEEIRERALQHAEKLIDKVAEGDDQLLEKYLEGESLSPEEIGKGLKKGFLEGKIVPLLAGSAEKGIGMKELLDFIVTIFPSPQEAKEVTAHGPSDEAVIKVKPDPKETFSAQVFKSVIDPYVGQMACFRVYSGTLRSDTGFYNVNKKQRERIGQLQCLQGKEQKPVGEVGPGELVAVAKLKVTQVGDSLCDESRPLLFSPIPFPEPIIRLALKPKTRQDEDKIVSALQKLSEEDSTFMTQRNPQTKELIIKGMGELHLDIMMERLKSRFGVEAITSLPKIAYRETIKSSTKVQGRYKKQSGGRGQYGDVWIEVNPLSRGEGFHFEDKVVGGVVPKNYIPAVEKGIAEAMEKGIIAGYPVTDIRVALYDGSYHTVDSSDMAFKIAGSMAIQKAVNEVQHCILEPIMKVEVTVPDEYMGDITGDLNSRRGRILGFETRGNAKAVIAEVPEAEMLDYSTKLRSITGGRGSFTMHFSRYDEVPQKQAEEIVARAKREKEAEKG